MSRITHHYQPLLIIHQLTIWAAHGSHTDTGLRPRDLRLVAGYLLRWRVQLATTRVALPCWLSNASSRQQPVVLLDEDQANQVPSRLAQLIAEMTAIPIQEVVFNTCNSAKRCNNSSLQLPSTEKNIGKKNRSYWEISHLWKTHHNCTMNYEPLNYCCTSTLTPQYMYTTAWDCMGDSLLMA